MSRPVDDDGQTLDIVEGSQVIQRRPHIVIPQTWWIRTSSVDENAVCLREQVLAEFLIAVGFIEEV